MKELPKYIVCAAIRRDGHIVCGARHFDGIMRSQLAQMGQNAGVYWEQGFIDNFGKFYTREEALKLALEMGQIRRTGGGFDLSKELFSENLY